MERRFELVLFDMDGTLIDNTKAVRENVNFALTKFGFDPAPGPEIDTQIGKFLPDIFKAFIPKDKWALADELSSAYRERYAHTSDAGLSILDGVREGLDYLRENNIKAGVVTNKLEGASALLQKIGLMENFSIVVSPNSELRPKPYPDMILHALKIEGIDAQKAAYVGDTAIDVHAARNAKVSSIAVLTGAKIGIVDLEELKESKPDFTIQDLSGMPKILSK